MPQPLDPAVEALLASAPRPPLAMLDPALSLAEGARAFRARDSLGRDDRGSPRTGALGSVRR